MELADLTRGMRKNDFLEPEKLFFCKAGWSEFHKVSVQKTIFKSLKSFFLQSWAGLSFIRLVCKNIFLEPEKLFFCKAGLV